MVLVLCACALTSSALAQPSPAPDRYATAYERYTDAACPIPADGIRHFVYFARDREALRDHPFLSNDRFRGAQIMYAWKNLEVAEGQYDFSEIEEDYAYLLARGKRLFVQLQDATFSLERHAIPDYLRDVRYDGGEFLQRDDEGRIVGWVAKRWNGRVQERFARLLDALGAQFDGRIEGINLQETAIEIRVRNGRDSAYTHEAYVAGVQANMRAMRAAFPRSTTLQYANFMPGEWLPGMDKGRLRSVYQYGEEIGVGLGAPDLMVRRQGQLNHALAMMHEGTYTVPLGIAVQDGNYAEATWEADLQSPNGSGEGPRRSIVPLLHAFAADFLRVDYMFWVNQAPYFEEEVFPCFTE